MNHIFSNSTDSLTPLFFDVEDPQGATQHVALFAGLTIGSSARCTIHVPGADSTHAMVLRGSQGDLILRCDEHAHILVGGAYPESCLVLVPGLSFDIGLTHFTCVEPQEVEPENDADTESSKFELFSGLGKHAGNFQEPAGDERCVRCQTNLSSLPIQAHFCPRCGLQLTARQAPYTPLSNPLALPHTLQPLEEVHSMILVGYASAMNTLGDRYERQRNPREAIRCYTKAANLGNIPATDHLIRKGFRLNRRRER